jgi:hypothetical protein
VPHRRPIFLAILLTLSGAGCVSGLKAQNGKDLESGTSPVARTLIGRPWEYDTLIYINEDSVCRFIIPLQLANEISHAKTYFSGDSTCKPVEFSLRFYDDLGNMLFRTTDVNKVWDFGPYMMDDYTWVLEYRLAEEDKKELNGTLVITE